MVTITRLKELAKKKKIPLYTTLDKEDLEDSLSNKKFSLGWRLKYIKPMVIDNMELRHIMYKLLGAHFGPHPSSDKRVRNIGENKKVMNFLKKHKVYITMTTSPMRLSKIRAVLATLDLTFVSKIYIVLPYRYGRDNKKYSQKTINKIKKFPKVHIIRVKKDLGPITKMIPVIEKMRDSKALVISIDDDVAYPIGMVNEMIYQKVVKSPGCIIEGGESIFHRGDIHNFRKLWPQKKKKRKPHTDIVEGWEGIVYNKKLTDTKMMRKLSKLSLDCKLSDDIIISYVLAKHDICRKQINNQYSHNGHPFEYGAQADALHQGGGSGKKDLNIEGHDDAYNFEKYEKCLQTIKNI